MSEVQHDEVKGLDEELVEESIEVITQDEKRIKIPKTLASMSEYIKGVIAADASAKEIPVKNVNAKTIEKIIQWMEYHKKVASRAIPRPLKSGDLKETVGPWDANYIDLDIDAVFDILLAANFLDIKPLLELCCARIASLMIGKTPKQIRKAFNLPDEFSPEEEARIRKEFAEFL
jgi:S-phase kinase-associated protein 1